MAKPTPPVNSNVAAALAQDKLGTPRITQFALSAAATLTVVAGIIPTGYAVTGINSFGDQVNPGQHLTRAEAIQLFTRNNSWFLRMEDKIGTIETGKLADLTVLDRDYFTVPDSDIRKIRSVFTVVNGRIVHDAGIA